MNRRLALILIVSIVSVLAWAVWAQCQIIDLGGGVLERSRITLSTAQSGIEYRNGTIRLGLSDGRPRYGLVEIVQGRTWNGVSYPDGKVDATFTDITFDGGFDFNCGFQDHNIIEANRRGVNVSLVTTITNSAGVVRFVDCDFVNCGGSAWAGSADRVEFIRCKAYRITQHVAGCRAAGNGRVKIDGLVCIECGSAFDLTFPDKTFRDLMRPDVAEINDLTAFDTTGRTKLASPNWIVVGRNWHFEQDCLANPNIWAAVDLASQPISFYVDGLTVKNFWACGFASLIDPGKDGHCRLRNYRCENSLRAAKVQQFVAIDGGVFIGCHSRYQSGSAVERAVDSTAPMSTQDAAKMVSDVERLYREFNAANGTRYRPSYWVPDEIKRLVILQ